MSPINTKKLLKILSNISKYQTNILNFKIILTLDCTCFSSFFQTHTAVSRVIETIGVTEGVSFPNKERVLQAYLHFEALTEHDYRTAFVNSNLM